MIETVFIIIIKIMKFLKGLFLWVLAWQVISLLTKDKNLREKLSWDASIWDKAKLVWDWLIELNQSIIKDIWWINWSDQIWKFEVQLKNLVDDFWENITVEQKETIKKAIEQATILVWRAKDFAENKLWEFNNDFQLSEKIEKIKSHIEWLKTKLDKSSQIEAPAKAESDQQ